MSQFFFDKFLFISQCCGPARPFDMNITDNTGMEVVITNIRHTITIFIIPDSPYMSIICLPPPPVQCVYGGHFPKSQSIAPKVIHLNRPLRCQACCFPCCLQELEVIIVINNGDVIVIVVLFLSDPGPIIVYPCQ